MHDRKSHLKTASRVPAIPAACLLIALTVLAYVPALDAGYVFDDSMYLTEDARMGAAGGPWSIWTQVGGPDYQHQYYPLTSTAFWVQYRLWGDVPVGYHLVNVLLHALNAVLLWRLLRRVGLPAAWLAGAIFAVHPVHVQSVAWISELKNVLSGFFFLASALVMVQYFDSESREQTAWRRRLTYLGGMLLFVCALLSKTATCLLPAALALVLWWKRDRVGARDLVALVPMLLLGVGFVSLTVFLESSYGGAQGEAFTQTWVERVLIAGRALWFYAGKLAWPADLVFIYPRWVISTHAWWQYVFPISAVLAIAALWWWRARIGKGPVTAVVYFFVAVVPLSFVNVAFTRLSYVSDHWQYWASMGLIALAAGAAAHAAGPWMRRPAGRLAAAGATVTVIALLAAQSWERCLVYESEETLWTDTVTRNPEAWVAHYNLGSVLSQQGRSDEAIRHYRKAAHIKPDYPLVHNNLGIELRVQGRHDEAIRSFAEALRLAPGFTKAHVNLGSTLLDLDRHEQANTCFRRALRIDPDFAGAHFNLGVALHAQGRTDLAIAHLGHALQLDPGFTGAHVKLGEVLRVEGAVDEAIAHFERALDLSPALLAAHYQLGVTLDEEGDRDAAIRQYRLALQIAPDNGKIHHRLGTALTAAGQTRLGLIHLEAGRRLDPGLQTAQGQDP
ncbi:MAG: tetratricopeptide repeat protein [Planctomycetota bacterium]|jgi:tetratricopeptide (TPR) repeat protein